MRTALVWFRRDLRLADNPALNAALEAAERVVPVYIQAPEEEAPWSPGGASRWWLHGSLEALDAALRARGSRLILRRAAQAETALWRLVQETHAEAVHWNRQYEPAAIDRDTRVKARLRTAGITAASHPGALIQEPWRVTRGDDQPYKVFTPYYKAARREPPPPPRRAPRALPPVDPALESVALDTLALRSGRPWEDTLARVWSPGEGAAHERLESFVEARLPAYGTARDQPAVPGTSGLSPHLRFGEVTPAGILERVAGLGEASEPFVRQLYWRDFAHQLLYHFPRTPEEPMDPRFADFPWVSDYAKTLRAWQAGETGIPLVDAGMRELWQTGWMHNRVRMTVASFLTKNLRIPWQVGEAWFWDTLVDADLANNAMGWQWVAGSGADAAPYFRIFNPVRQSERFDAKGAYIHRWLPELTPLAPPALFDPSQARPETLRAAGVRLERDYPRAIVDLQASRRAALAAYETIKGAGR
jgi:deoxyribodipyrimidine photo-lyase